MGSENVVKGHPQLRFLKRLACHYNLKVTYYSVYKVSRTRNDMAFVVIISDKLCDNIKL